MPIVVHNTKSGRKEPLAPLEPGHIKMYVCGITAYDYCHIGHARSVLVFDMVVRYLRYRGLQVTFIRNFTDIDDKIIKRAAEQNTTCEELSQRFIRCFHEDMARLKITPPDLEPLATGHIPEMIALIEELIAKGLAYPMGGDVYFKVEVFPAYGALAGRNLEEMQAGARVAVNENKRHPMDFALWKGSKPGEPTWESPWGPGRPGWHIECSAMGRKYLGDTFDIHGGGKDLVFPHHENEIAQSEGATGKPFAKVWLHHGFVTIKDEKMSKSLGNFLTIREVLERYSAETLRLFIFSTHYRNPLDYSESAMKDNEAALTRLYTCLAEVAALPEAGDPAAAPLISAKDRRKLEEMVARFEQAMDNDFNTALGLAQLFETARIINKIRPTLPPSPAPADLALLRRIADAIRQLGGIMGLLGDDPVAHLQTRRENLLAALAIGRAEIEALISERNQVRAAKDWPAADRIRDRLLAHQVELKDSAEGTTWDVKMM